MPKPDANPAKDSPSLHDDGESRNHDPAGIPLNRLHIWQIQAIRDVLILGAGVLTVLMGYWLRSVTVPLLVAMTLAYLFEPIILWIMNRYRISRPTAVAGVVGGVGVLAAVILIPLVPLLGFQMIQFVKSAPQTTQTVLRRASDLPEVVRLPLEESLGKSFDDLAEDWSTNIVPDDGQVQDQVQELHRFFVEAVDTPDEQRLPVEAFLGVRFHEVSSQLTDVINAEDPDDLRRAYADAHARLVVRQLAEAPDDVRTPFEESVGTTIAEFVQDINTPATGVAPVTAWFRDNLSSIFEFTVKTTGEAFSVLSAIAGSVIYAGFLMFLIPFYFFYFSTSWPNIRRFVRGNIPPEHFEREYELVGRMDAAISGFVRGRIVISAIMGIMLAVGWGFCGVPYWLLLGLMTGVLCAVPYLGGIGLPFAIVLLWVGQGGGDGMEWWAILLWPTVVFGFVQLLEGYVLTPYIAGKATDLGPVSILVAVLAGGVVMGIYGMLLAIPAMACLKILFMDVFLPRVQQWATGQAEDILPIENG